MKAFVRDFSLFYALKFRLFLGSAEFLASFKVHIDGTSPPEKSEISMGKCTNFMTKMCPSR